MISGFLGPGDTNSLFDKVVEYKLRKTLDRTYRSVFVLGCIDDYLLDISKRFKESRGFFDSLVNFFEYKKQYIATANNNRTSSS